MIDHEHLAKLFEAALKEPDPIPERKRRNSLPSKNVPAADRQAKPSSQSAAPGRDDRPGSAKAS